MTIIAIDPGTDSSAAVWWNGSWEQPLLRAAHMPNVDMLKTLQSPHPGHILVCEKIASYGMAVGESTFETVFWTGRFCQAFDGLHYRITRGQVKMHLCQSMRAKDANIRQALIDKFGPVGTKKNPGKLYGISKHLWAALAVAVTYDETRF